MSKTVVRVVATYVMSMLFIAFFIAPLIAPTDVAPPGAEPLSGWEVAAQCVAIYGLPVIFVILDLRLFRSKRD